MSDLKKALFVKEDYSSDMLIVDRSNITYELVRKQANTCTY